MISKHLAEMRSIVKEARERLGDLYYPMQSLNYEMDDKILGYVDVNHIKGAVTDADDAAAELLLVLSMKLQEAVENEERVEEEKRLEEEENDRLRANN